MESRYGTNAAVEAHPDDLLVVLDPPLDAPVAPVEPMPSRRKRTWNRREKDRSQAVRSSVQLFFLILSVWIGVQFFFWVRYYESGGTTMAVSRPAGVEGWLPIASLMNLKAWVLTGDFPSIHPAGMVLLVAFLAVSFLFRKAFCSWICPIGTISEVLGQVGKKMFRRNFGLPRWVDLPLRGIKYLLLALFLYAVGSMSVDAIRAFLEGPYGIVADVKMLNFFRDLSTASAVVILLLVGASLLVRNFWCRFLCPYGALMGLTSWFSPAAIRRDPGLCIDCARCAKACPSRLSVDKAEVVRSPECLACYQCVAVCPVDQALELKVGSRRTLSPLVVAVGVAVIFLGAYAAARATGHWSTEVPDSMLFELVPRADSFSHP